jgi:6-phosphogluconolactonase
MLALSMSRKREFGIFLKMMIMAVWAIGIVSILSSCGDSPGYNYTISGTVSGMTGTGLVLQNNVGDDLKISENGSFSFATALTNGASYSITIKTQPSNPSQQCIVTNDTGSINGAPVSNVTVSCEMSSYPVVVDSSSHFAYMIRHSAANTQIAAYNIVSGNIDSAGNLIKISYYDTAANATSITLYPDPASGAAAGQGKYLYVTDFTVKGVVLFYSIDSGKLTKQQTVDAGGDYPASVTIAKFDESKKFAYVANMGSNSISAYSIAANDDAGANVVAGQLKKIAGSPFKAGTNPTGVTIAKVGGIPKYAYVANLSSGTISAYSIAANAANTDGANVEAGQLTEISGSPFSAGTYPTAVTVDVNGKFAYVSNMGSDTISAFTIGTNTDSTGPGSLIPISGTFNTGIYPTPVTIAKIDDTTQFAYVSNIGSSTISAYTIASDTGVLTEVTGPFSTGVYPGPITIAKITGSTTTFAVYVSNMGSSSISGNTIDYTNTKGKLTSIAGSPFPVTSTTYPTTYPNTVTVDPAAKYAYVSDSNSGDIWFYKINQDNGILTLYSVIPF